MIITKQFEQEQTQGRERMQEIMEELSLADDMGKEIQLILMYYIKK